MCYTVNGWDHEAIKEYDLVRELMQYAQAVVNNDTREYNRVRASLINRGYHFSGYVGNPVVYDSDNNVVGQISYNYTKSGSYMKRCPFTITTTK